LLRRNPTTILKLRPPDNLPRFRKEPFKKLKGHPKWVFVIQQQHLLFAGAIDNHMQHLFTSWQPHLESSARVLDVTGRCARLHIMYEWRLLDEIKIRHRNPPPLTRPGRCFAT
jgi:hypothetical protein